MLSRKHPIVPGTISCYCYLDKAVVLLHQEKTNQIDTTPSQQKILLSHLSQVKQS